MSSTTETILLTVDIQANSARLVELQKQLNENKAALLALNQAAKEGRLSADELAAGQLNLAASSKNAQNEVRILTTANQAQQKANEASKGSIEQLRAELALGTAAYNKLSQEERDNTAAGQKLQAGNKAISDSLKGLEKAVGDTRRNVGNYNEGIKDVNVVNGQLVGGLRTAIDKGLSPFKDKIEQGTGLLGKFRSGSDLVSQGMGLLKGGGETGALGFKALAGGIALTGIGLFVIAISAVVAYFTQTAEGGRILAGVLGGLGGVLQVATDLVTGLGKAIVYAVTHPLEAIENFGATLGNALLHPIDTARALASGVGKVADRIKVAYVASSEFAARTRELTIARRELDKQDAIEGSRVLVLLRLSKERGKAADEQLKSLANAGQIERKITEDNISLKQKELKLIDDKIKAAGAGKTAELKADKAAKELEIIQAGTDRDEMNTKIRVRESVFKEKLRADAKAAAKTAREDAVKAKQTEVEQQLLTVLKGSAAELVLLQRKIDLAAALVLASEKKTAQDRKLILETAEVEKRKLQDEFNAKAIENAKKHDAAVVAEAQREYAEAQKSLEDYLSIKRAMVEADIAAGVISKDEGERRLDAIEKAGNQAALVNAKDYGKQTGAIQKKIADDDNKLADKALAKKKKIAQAEQDIRDASLGAASIASDLVIEAFGAESTAGQAALAIKKTLALAEIGINLEKQLSANAAAGTIISGLAPPVTVPLGVAYTVATDALAIAGAAAGAAKILGFNSGGMVPGVGSTDTVPAMLTPGEVVMNQQASQSFTPLLSYLNSISGGASFGPSARGSNDGGLSARAVGNSGLIDYGQLAAAMSQVDISVDVRRIAAEQAKSVRPRALTRLGG